MFRKKMVLLGMGFLILLSTMGMASAAEYPQQQIKIIVPFSPGGGVDTTIRLLTASVEKLTDKAYSFVIVNKPGGGAVIGQTEVSQAQPDGYTLLAATSSLVSNTIKKKVTYTIDSFEPIIMYCFDPEIIVVPADSPLKTLEDAISTGNDKELVHITPGLTTSHHLAGLIFTDLTGSKFRYVHTNGGAKQILQLAGGHGDFGMTSYGAAESMIKAGKLRVLAIADKERSKYLPSIPTLQEKGIDLIYGAWRGIAAPAGTPKDIIAKLNDEFKKGTEDPEFIEKMNNSGYPISYKGAEEFSKYIDNNHESLKIMFEKMDK